MRRRLTRMGEVLFWLLVSLGSGRFAVAAQPLVLELRPEAVVSGAYVRVADVATLSGGDPAVAPIVEQLLLGAAPAIGADTIVAARQVEARLFLEGYGPDRVRLAGAEACLVRRAGEVVGRDCQALIREAVMGVFRRTFHDVPAAEVDMEDFRLTGAAGLEHAPTGIRPVGVEPDGAVRMGEPARFVVHLGGPEGFQTLVRVEATPRRLVTLIVAVRPLPSRSILGPDDVACRRVDRAAPFGALVSAEEAIGQRLRRNLGPGEPLLQTDLEAVPVIRSGETVDVILVRSYGEIRIKGRVEADGFRGRQVMVRNVRTNRVFPALVLGPGRVRALVGGP